MTTTELSSIDHLGEHPHFYMRKEVPVLLKNGERVDAWLYFCENGTGRINRSGDFACFQGGEPRRHTKVHEKKRFSVHP